MTYSDFANFLNERMRERGCTPKRLSEVSGVSVKHVEALRHADLERLPSAPYVRGYLTKLGNTLEFNAEEWWNRMKQGSAAEELGPRDELPKNRFTREPIRAYLLSGAIALVLLSYFGFRFHEIIGTPVIAIAYPQADMTTVDANWISLKGTVRNSDGLRVNGETVPVGVNGDWEKTITLDPGINTIELTAQKFLGRETKVVRQIIYEPPKPQTSSTPASTTSH